MIKRENKNRTGGKSDGADKTFSFILSGAGLCYFASPFVGWMTFPASFKALRRLFPA